MWGHLSIRDLRRQIYPLHAFIHTTLLLWRFKKRGSFGKSIFQNKDLKLMYPKIMIYKKKKNSRMFSSYILCGQRQSSPVIVHFREQRTLTSWELKAAVCVCYRGSRCEAVAQLKSVERHPRLAPPPLRPTLQSPLPPGPGPPSAGPPLWAREQSKSTQIDKVTEHESWSSNFEVCIFLAEKET